MSVTDHYNAVARSPPARGYMQELRRAHNSVKWGCFTHAISIGTARVPYRVLDLACGRGGDYVKHASSKACCAYYGVDIAEAALDELEHRSTQCPFIPSMHLQCGDVADVKWKNKDVDVCTLNFALHYFFDTKQHLDALLRIVGANLRPGGIFCGTYFDYTFLSTCPYASTQGNWPNDVQLQINPYGHVYHYKMGKCVDAPEYVVHFPTLCQLACKYGLYLCMDRSFASFILAHRLGVVNAQAGQRIFMFRKCHP